MVTLVAATKSSVRLAKGLKAQAQGYVHKINVLAAKYKNASWWEISLVAWDAVIDFCGPRQNSAVQIVDFAEACLPQEVHRLRGTVPGPAMRHDFTRGIEFVYAARQFPEWNQMAFEIADLIFVGLAYIQDENVVAAVQALLQFARGNFRHVQIRFRLFFTTNAAKFVVID